MPNAHAHTHARMHYQHMMQNPLNRLSRQNCKSITCISANYTVDTALAIFSETNLLSVFSCMTMSFQSIWNFPVSRNVLHSFYYKFVLHYGDEVFPWLRVFRASSSAVRQMSGYNSQRRGMARTSQFTTLFFFVTVVCVPFTVLCVLFVCVCVCVLLPPGVNAIAVK
jgi:hypothetical protein